MSIPKTHVTRRNFMKVALFGTTAGILAACGGQTAPAPAPQSSETKEAAPVATDAPKASSLEGKKGVQWGLKYDPHVEAYKRLATLFNKVSGATVSVEPQDWPIEQKLIPAMAAGTPPDVVCIMGKSLLPLHLQKALMPLKDSVYASAGVDPEKDFIGDGVGGYTWKSEIWGVPVESNQVGSMVNIPVDDAKAAGVWEKYPPGNGKQFFDSYEEMWQMAKELQKEEGGKVVKWGLTS
ncbi:MAG: extracellular solute-binding protein, partial [Chloroflexi bacterium]|nr:extracellular solute-binding protein [Chloroflexota bacterium]